MILSLDYQNYHAQILTADAQFSHGDGVIVLVTGCLTGNNNDRRKFTQTFFLAPQDNGYFVLNDIFRYIDEEITNGTSNNADGNSPIHTLTPTIGRVQYLVYLCLGLHISLLVFGSMFMLSF